MPDLLDGPSDARHHLILAHGAGEGPDSPFLTKMARALAAGGVGVTRFAFPCMLEAARSGRRRPPDLEPVLRAAWREAIRVTLARGANPQGLIIGGKSMGGRIASLIADEVGPAGLICLGYPFHPPGRPERLRTAHLAALRTPTLICQGTRDPFGRPEEVADYALSPAIRVVWVPDGEHGYRPTKASGRTWEDNLDLAGREVLAFLRVLWMSGSDECLLGDTAPQDRRAKSRRRLVGVIADGPGWGMAAEGRAGQGASYRVRFGPDEETSPRTDPETSMDPYMDADGRFFPRLTRSSPCLDAPLTLRPITLRPSFVPVRAHPTRRGVLRCRPHRPRQPCNPPRSAVPAWRLSSKRARVSQGQAPELWAGPDGTPNLQWPELAVKPVRDPSPTIPTTIKRSQLP